MLASRKRLTGAAALAVVASGLLAPPARPGLRRTLPAPVSSSARCTAPAATPARRASTHDFVELYNPTGDARARSSGLDVQYRSAAPAASARRRRRCRACSVPRGWSLPGPGERRRARTAPALPTPDASTGPAISMAAARRSGVPAVPTSATARPTRQRRRNAGVVDMRRRRRRPPRFEGAATAAGVDDQSTQPRAPRGADTDSNAADFTVGTPDAATGAGAPAALDATDAGRQDRRRRQRRSRGFNLAATGGTTPYTWSATGLPAGVDRQPPTARSPAPRPPPAPTTSPVTVTDSAPARRRPTPRPSPSPSPRPPARHADRGHPGHRATSSPITGQVVTTQGVVTASYPTGGLNGFYIQTPGADTADASDAIFVYGGASGFATYPAIGDSVDVTGTVARELRSDRAHQRDLVGARLQPRHGDRQDRGPGHRLPAARQRLRRAAALDTAREAAEGEAFQPTATWTLTDVYDGGPAYTVGTNAARTSARSGVAADSTKPLIAPTELVDAQTQATELAEPEEVERRAPDRRSTTAPAPTTRPTTTGTRRSRG